MPLEYWLYTDKEGFIQVRHEYFFAVHESKSGTEPLCCVPKSEYIRADRIEKLIEKWKDDKEHGHSNIPVDLLVEDLQELLKEQSE